MRISPSVSALIISVVIFGPKTAVAFAPSVSTATAQDEVPAEVPEPVVEREFPLNRLKRLQREEQLSGLEGAWRLHAYQDGPNPVSSDEIVGNAIFADGFMSLMIHATGYDDDSGEESDLAQAGVFRFAVNDYSNLQSITVLAHASPPSFSAYERVVGLQPESTGSLREYGLSVEPGRIELRHHTGTRLTFIRMPTAELSVLEIARLGQADNTPTEPVPAIEEVAIPLEEQIIGGWYLSGYLLEGSPVSTDDISGSVIFSDGYMGLVIHAYEYVAHGDGGIDEEVLYAQAGIYQYRLKDSLYLQTSTVIGHSNPYDDVDYETTGSLRQYQVSIEDEQLILRSADETALRFDRIKHREFTQFEEAQLKSYQSGARLIYDE
ncbi:MAG: hypothetical protein ACI8TQ_002996 [Planctomycetota bacterium]|jgi:hypothetical protein